MRAKRHVAVDGRDAQPVDRITLAVWATYATMAFLAAWTYWLILA